MDFQAFLRGETIGLNQQTTQTMSLPDTWSHSDSSPSLPSLGKAPSALKWQRRVRMVVDGDARKLGAERPTLYRGFTAGPVAGPEPFRRPAG